MTEVFILAAVQESSSCWLTVFMRLRTLYTRYKHCCVM